MKRSPLYTRLSLCLLSSLALPAAEAAPHPSSTQDPARDIGWLATSGTWADVLPEHGCVTSTLQTSYALVAFIDAGSDDYAVDRALLGNIASPELRQLRQEELALWHRQHDPALAAARHLPGCLNMVGIRLAASPVLNETLRVCLKQTEPVALAAIHRRAGHPEPEAVKAVAARYAAPVLKEAPGALVHRVYTLPHDADDLRLREEIFDGCLQAAQRPATPHAR